MKKLLLNLKRPRNLEHPQKRLRMIQTLRRKSRKLKTKLSRYWLSLYDISIMATVCQHLWVMSWSAESDNCTLHWSPMQGAIIEDSYSYLTVTPILIFFISDINSDGETRKHCQHIKNSVVTENIFRSQNRKYSLSCVHNLPLCFSLLCNFRP